MSAQGSRFEVWSTLVGGEAVRALSRNKLRSALAALGITIGIAAVVAVVAIGTAGSEHAEAQLANLGDNLVWIEAGSRNVAGARTGSHGTTSLTVDDEVAILREVPLLKSCSPQVDGNVLLARGNRNWTTHYRGVNPDFLDIRRWVVAEGSAFSEVSVEGSDNVCLIGKTVREQLFPGEDPVGKEIRVMTQVFRVIGVLAPKGQSGFGQDQDDTVMLPFTTAQKKLKGRGFEWVDDIMCSALSRDEVAAAIGRVSDLMRERHHIRPGEEDDFNIRRPEELIKAEIEASRTLALLLISVASVSLLVGGIGIMNVMLVSVTQRTREIGMRLAIGASERAIRSQFLGEALAISLVGGVLGIGLGVVTSLILGAVLKWPMTIPPLVLVVAPVFAIAVGLFFGLYPAWRASRLDPIAALRHE